MTFLGVLIGLSLGTVGAGGSILAVPVLVYVAGESPALATASSLVVVCVTALVALRPHWAAGRVRADVAVPFGVVGVAGSLAGKVLSERLDPNLLMLAFSALMAVAAAVTARRSQTTAGRPAVETEQLVNDEGSSLAVRERTRVPAIQLNRVLTAGLSVGLMTGFFGVGGGFVIVPALVIGLGLPMTEAIGTSLLIIAINSATAFGLKARGVHLDWPLLATLTSAAVAGAVVGGHVSSRLDGALLSRWFVRIVMGVAAYTALRSFIALAA